MDFSQALVDATVDEILRFTPDFMDEDDDRRVAFLFRIIDSEI